MGPGGQGARGQGPGSQGARAQGARATLNVHTERYGGTAPTLLIVSSYVSCLTGAVVFAWDRSLLIVCSQDICCVCSQDICIVSSQDICIVSSQGICIEDICILSHLNAANHNIRAAQPRACCSFYH